MHENPSTDVEIDYEASADKDASLFQTSENAAFKYNERERLRQEVRDALAVIQVPRDQLQYMDLGPHEFAPVVAIYLRPAQTSDAAQIAAIYNHCEFVHTWFYYPRSVTDDR